MKTIRIIPFVLAFVLLAGVRQGAAQGTAFTYQGRLNSGTSSATGLFDLTFTLFSVSSGAGQVGSPVTNSATAVTNGLFTTTLDFGAGHFPGAARWMEIGVRTNGNGAFETLSPRQRITATPYAITASNVTGVVPSGSVAGTYGSAVTFNNAANNFSGAFSGNGAELTNVNALTLGGLGSSNFWKTGGNAGTSAGTNFLGTADFQPLELKVNGTRALRLEPTANSATRSNIVNVVGGSPVNFVGAGVIGATIGGGGAGNYSGLSFTNKVTGDFGTVGGGVDNTSSGGIATVGGGYANVSSANYGTVGGGFQNTSSGGGATIGGGSGNNASNTYATVGGGFQNVSGGDHATVAGGDANTSSGDRSTVGGGQLNVSSGNRATVGGGSRNASSAQYGTVGGGTGNTNSGQYATIGGGYQNTNSGLAATVAGGQENTSSGDFATVGGGVQNTSSNYATVAGGYVNASVGHAATVGGGYQNTSSGQYATVPGGYLNHAASNYTFAAGYRAKATNQGAFVWADSQNADFGSTANNQFLIRANGGVGVGKNNPVTALDVNGTVTATAFSGSGSGLAGVNAATLGGLDNANFWKTGGNAGTTAGTHFLGTTDNQSLEFKVNGLRVLRLEPTPNTVSLTNIVNVVGGSAVNFVGAGIVGATIGGGGAGNYFGARYTNRVLANFGTVAGGTRNTTSGDRATVSGGEGNTASAPSSTVSGGQQNTSSGAQHATVGGGRLNMSSGDSSTVAGGFQNTSSGHGATVPGGFFNDALGQYSFAAGYRAKANHQGAFVWGDSEEADVFSTGINQFLVRAGGGVGIGATNLTGALFIRQPTGEPAAGMNSADNGLGLGQLSTSGYKWIQSYGGSLVLNPLQNNVGINKTDPGSALDVNGTVTATAFNPPSDRNLKENFKPVNPRAVLEKVAGMTVSEWNFKEDRAVRHVGPMAQDFHAAFGLGTDERHIATVDADGVALAAIQGLNEVVREKDAKISALEKRLADLEKIVSALAARK